AGQVPNSKRSTHPNGLTFNWNLHFARAITAGSSLTDKTSNRLKSSKLSTGRIDLLSIVQIIFTARVDNKRTVSSQVPSRSIAAIYSSCGLIHYSRRLPEKFLPNISPVLCTHIFDAGYLGPMTASMAESLDLIVMD